MATSVFLFTQTESAGAGSAARVERPRKGGSAVLHQQAQTVLSVEESLIVCVQDVSFYLLLGWLACCPSCLFPHETTLFGERDVKIQELTVIFKSELFPVQGEERKRKKKHTHTKTWVSHF